MSAYSQQSEIRVVLERVRSSADSNLRPIAVEIDPARDITGRKRLAYELEFDRI